MAGTRSQSAMEYLSTYSWALIILAVTLGSLYALGLFSPNNIVHDLCIFQADISCTMDTMNTAGVLTINVQQSTQSPINITAIGCNTNITTTGMTTFTGANRINMVIGGNAIISVQCLAGPNSAPFSGKIGEIYKGYVILNYTNLQTGYPHTTVGKLVQGITSK